MTYFQGQINKGVAHYDPSVIIQKSHPHRGKIPNLLNNERLNIFSTFAKCNGLTQKSYLQKAEHIYFVSLSQP